MVETTYSYPTDRQSIRRCQRMGKERDVNVYYLTLESDFSLIKSFERRDLTKRYTGGKAFRPSQMSTLEKCAGSFWVKPEAKPSYITAAAIQGTVNHWAVERYLRKPKVRLTDDVPEDTLEMIKFCRGCYKNSLYLRN